MSTYAIGIDPSLTGTAIAGFSVYTLTKGDGDERLAAIHAAVTDEVRTFKGAFAWFVVVEDLPTHARGGGLTAMAHGVVRLALTQTKTPYVLIPPATLKKYATGKGNATKADMRMAWYKRSGEDIRDDNQVDALWLRDIGRYAVDDDRAIQLPKAQRECLFKLTWPENITARMLAPYEVAEVG